VTCRVLLLCGSLRQGSTNGALLATAQAVAPDGVEAVWFDGVAGLAHFNPDDDAEPLPAGVADLRRSLGAADALLISTPEYAGALPGSFKNVFDWAVGGGEIYEKPVAWVNVAASSGRAAHAHQSLRLVLTYAGTDIVESACAEIPVQRADVGPDGLVTDPATRAEVAAVVQALADHVGQRRAG
jgi:chromate reductase, NAD(P)H dehydrogenase (quinone)